MVDNFEEIRKHLTFESDFDRYIVHILKRSKDDKGKTYGVNETNRLIKTFYITSLDYFDRKIPVIRDMCDSYGARAYVLPQVRNNGECLRELLKITVDNLSNPTIKPDHLVRSAFCGHHGSRDKKWILDLDSDNMVEYVRKDSCAVKSRTWTPTEVFDFVRNQLVSVGKDGDDAYMVPTKSGHCIVTSPFDLKSAQKKCSMLFSGVRKTETEWVWSGPGEGSYRFSDVNGWLLKDGMCLMYAGSV